MRHLSHKDFDDISAFLRELYAEVRFENLPRVMVDGLSRLIPCEHAGYNEIDSRTNSSVILMRPFAPDVLKLAPVLEAHFAEHPQLSHYRVSTDRKAYRFTDICSQQQFRETGIYRDFYRHVRTDSQLACVLSELNAPCDIGIGINRFKQDFSERDQAVLDFLRPHLIQARQNALAFTGAGRKLQLMDAAMADQQTGAATLDREGRLDWATSKVVPWLECYFPGSLRFSPKLPEPLDRWVRDCRARLVDGTLAVNLTYTAAAADSKLIVRFAPDRFGVDRLLFSEEKYLAARDMARARGLTVREAEVMQWIVEGKTNPEIATILGTSTRTIHKHVERIFAKLGVQTRSAAVRELVLPHSS